MKSLRWVNFDGKTRYLKLFNERKEVKYAGELSLREPTMKSAIEYLAAWGRLSILKQLFKGEIVYQDT